MPPRKLTAEERAQFGAFTPNPTGRVLAQFSCGAASAVATKLALEKYGERVTICYADPGSEHPDNRRFLKDCEAWFGQPINVLKSEEYSDTWEVFEAFRFLSSQAGARCTGELKRKPSNDFWRFGDIEIFGYTADENHRLNRFRRDNNERIIECPLIDAGLTKQDCLDQIAAAGIEIPAMYKLGFRNNNCIGCVKARDSIDYWKRVRKYFPDQFNRMAALERELNFALNRITRNGKRRKVFLDELPPGDPKGADPNIQCGLFCSVDHSPKDRPQ